MGLIKDITGFLSNKNLNNFIFVETGTYHGESALAASKLGFKKVYTIEIQPYLYEQSKINLSEEINSNKIELILGDSKEIVPKILKNHEDEQFVFWLDAHIDAGNYKEGITETDTGLCALYSEIYSISKHKRKDNIIIVDDLRAFGDPQYGHAIPGWGLGISKNTVISMIKSINPNYNIHFLNGSIENDILVASIDV